MSSTGQGGFLFTVYTALCLLLKVPILAICYFNPSFRPHRTWSYRLALTNEIVKALFDFRSNTRFLQPRIHDTGETSRFVTIEPVPHTFLRMPLIADSVSPSPVNGIWYGQHLLTSPASSSSEACTLLHFHGGAFVFLSPSDPSVSEGLQALASAIPGCAILAPEYRLASRPGCTFPAQLQDALSAYYYLIKEVGVSSSKIVLSGDSAGANIVVGLLRYLHQHTVLPMPSAALLFSPWLNLSEAACQVERNTNCKTDFVTTAFLQWGAKSVTPKSMERDAIWISPFFHPFECKVPLWVQDGTAEVLHDDILIWIEMMRQKGTKIEYYGAVDMIHNLIYVAVFMGLKDERARSFEGAKDFLSTLYIKQK